MGPDLERVFKSYPPEYKDALLDIRQLIYAVAENIPEVGDLEESLKWGQASYVPVKAKTGSPIRLDRFDENKVALFFHCQTTLVDQFRTLFQDRLEFSKNRAIVIDPKKPLQREELALCIELALTYHLNKKKADNNQ